MSTLMPRKLFHDHRNYISCLSVLKRHIEMIHPSPSPSVNVVILLKTTEYIMPFSTLNGGDGVTNCIN